MTINYCGYDTGFYENELVEAHGMLFDILVIGVFILALNKLAEKRIENQRYLDEIDDFRGWKSEEAGFRIVGNIKRLSRNRYKAKLDLRKCHLASVNLEKADLKGADLTGVDLWLADLRKVKGLDIDQLSGVKTLYEAKLGPKLEKQVKEKYPHLLERPEEEKK